MAPVARPTSGRFAAVRRHAVGLPEAWEDQPWGETVVKVGKKVFVFLGGDGPGTMSVKLDEAHEEALASPGATPTHYGLGRHGWVSVSLGPEAPPPLVLCDWVEESYCLVAPKRLVRALEATLPVRGGTRRPAARPPVARRPPPGLGGDAG